MLLIEQELLMRQVLLVKGFLLLRSQLFAELLGVLLDHVLDYEVGLELRSVTALHLASIVLTAQECGWLRSWWILIVGFCMKL